jgi:hypothetical protein
LQNKGKRRKVKERLLEKGRVRKGTERLKKNLKKAIEEGKMRERGRW